MQSSFIILCKKSQDANEFPGKRLLVFPGDTVGLLQEELFAAVQPEDIAYGSYVLIHIGYRRMILVCYGFVDIPAYVMNAPGIFVDQVYGLYCVRVA